MNELRKQTLEKTLAVKKAMEEGKFKRIEDACKKVGISPASYYNYSKEISLSDKHGKGFHLPQSPISAANWTEEIEALRRENEELKRKLELNSSTVMRLKLKLADTVLSMQ